MLGQTFGFWRASDVASPFIWDFDLGNADDVPATAVFSRSTTGSVVDHQKVYRHCLAGELRRKGLRRVENLFPGSDTPATQINIPVVVGARYAFYFRAGGGNGSYAISDAATETVAEGEGFHFTATTTTLDCALSGTPGGSATVQLEENSGASSNVPSEYVDIDVEHQVNGANGVKYFSTNNGNSFDGAEPSTVTEAAGSAIAEATREGGLVEGAATCYTTRNFVTGWTHNGNVSTSRVAEGLDGRGNKATIIIDADAGQTSQTRRIVVLPTGTYTGSVFLLKDLAATALVEVGFSTSDELAHFHIDLSDGTSTPMTFNDGSTLAVVEAFVGNQDWWKVSITLPHVGSASSEFAILPASGTVPGTRNGVAQGSVTADFPQLINGEVSESPIIFETDTPVTRNADLFTMPFAQGTPWTLFQDCQPQTVVDVAAHALMGYENGSDEANIERGTDAYDFRISDVSNSVSLSRQDTSPTPDYVMGNRLKVSFATPDGDAMQAAINGSGGVASGTGVVITSGFATVGLGQMQSGGPDIPITIRRAYLKNEDTNVSALETETTI